MVLNGSECTWSNKVHSAEFLLENLTVAQLFEKCCRLWNLKVYFIHNSPPVDFVLNQLNPVTLIPLASPPPQSTPTSSQVIPLLQDFWPKICMHFLSLLRALYAHQSHPAVHRLAQFRQTNFQWEQNQDTMTLAKIRTWYSLATGMNNRVFDCELLGGINTTEEWLYQASRTQRTSNQECWLAVYARNLC